MFQSKSGSSCARVGRYYTPCSLNAERVQSPFGRKMPKASKRLGLSTYHPCGETTSFLKLIRFQTRFKLSYAIMEAVLFAGALNTTDFCQVPEEETLKRGRSKSDEFQTIAYR